MPRARRGDKNRLNFKRRLRSEMTSAEARLWARLRAAQLHGLKFRRQHGIGRYLVDFYCPARAVVIELDGETHAEPDQIDKDHERTAYLNSLGLAVLRYTNHDVHSNLEGVLDDVGIQLRLGPSLG